jgi:hypothetical protein
MRPVPVTINIGASGVPHHETREQGWVAVKDLAAAAVCRVLHRTSPPRKNYGSRKGIVVAIRCAGLFWNPILHLQLIEPKEVAEILSGGDWSSGKSGIWSAQREVLSDLTRATGVGCHPIDNRDRRRDWSTSYGQ